jgi:hypothetical protein
MPSARSRSRGTRSSRASGPAWHAEILALKDRRERVWVDKVWQWARANPASALHRKFNWDIEEAAEEYWRIQTSELIRQMRMMVQYEDRALPVPTRQFVAEMLAKQSHYVDIDTVRADPKRRTKQLNDELERIRRAVRNGMSNALYYKLVPYFKKELDQIIKDETQ